MLFHLFDGTAEYLESWPVLGPSMYKWSFIRFRNVRLNGAAAVAVGQEVTGARSKRMEEGASVASLSWPRGRDTGEASEEGYSRGLIFPAYGNLFFFFSSSLPFATAEKLELAAKDRSGFTVHAHRPSPINSREAAVCNLSFSNTFFDPF